MKALAISIVAALTLTACGGGGDDSSSGSAVATYSSCGSFPNYNNEIGTIRWRQLPLTVFLDLTFAPDVNVGNNRQMYTDAITAGLVSWTAAGGGIGTFRYIDNPNDADLIVRFGSTSQAIQQVGGPPSFGIAGVTIFRREGNLPTSYITKGTTIVFDTQVFTVRKALGITDFRDVRNPDYPTFVRFVAAHEMGHALFVNGHPRTPGVLMNDGGGALQVTQTDINSAKEAYCRQ